MLVGLDLIIGDLASPGPRSVWPIKEMGLVGNCIKFNTPSNRSKSSRQSFFKKGFVERPLGPLLMSSPSLKTTTVRLHHHATHPKKIQVRIEKEPFIISIRNNQNKKDNQNKSNPKHKIQLGPK